MSKQKVQVDGRTAFVSGAASGMDAIALTTPELPPRSFTRA
jgi:hypothetical protein